MRELRAAWHEVLVDFSCAESHIPGAHMQLKRLIKKRMNKN
jgi:hypothetical protein